MTNMENQVNEHTKETSLTTNSEMFIDGFWIHLSEGDHQIDVYFSNFFWRQAVFLDGKKISQKSCASKHSFQIEGRPYHLKTSHSSFKDGKCELYCDGSLKDSADFSWFNEETKSEFYKIAILHAVFGGGFGIITIFIFLTLFRLF